MKRNRLYYYKSRINEVRFEHFTNSDPKANAPGLLIWDYLLIKVYKECKIKNLIRKNLNNKK